MSHKALAVGINNYPNARLNGCENDAKEISKILERHENGNPNFDIKTILNIDTKGELKGLIKECFNGDDEISLFYFSGHGYIDSIGGYIITPDYEKDDWGVSMQDILAIINASKCKNKIVILDCCHSGFMGNISSIGQNAALINEGVTILTASKSNESAIEENGHGIFTSLLLDALNGGAADITGNITLGGIYAYIDKTLGRWQQRPVFKTNVKEFVSLRSVTPRVDIKTLRRALCHFISPNEEFSLNPSFEPTNSEYVPHEIIEPYADGANTSIFADLQKLVSIGLVAPVATQHMYFAAMESKSCKLTSAGRHYWQLVKENKI